MKEITLLPADNYIVVNKTVISKQDNNIVSMLYQPIIGYTAVALYYTLIDDLDKYALMSSSFTHHHLMSTMQLSLDKILIARKKLEAVGLLKTYYKEDNNLNNFVYMLYSPLSSYDFFHHPILNIVLYNNLGKNEYDKLLDYFKVPRVNLKDYFDITENFSDIFSAVPGTVDIQYDVSKREEGNIKIEPVIDFDFLISSIPKNLYSDRCFSDDVKELINTISYTYNLDTNAVISLVRDSINEKGLFDKAYFRKTARNYYQFRNDGALPTIIYKSQPEYLKKPVGDNSKWAKMVYTFENTSPYRFLKAKSHGTNPTSRDLKIVEDLLVEQKLNPGVVNVLISYTLKVNNEKLNKNYVETIAGQWKRLGVETVEEAMKRCETEYKKRKNLKTVTKTIKNDSKVPEWFNKNLDKDLTNSDEIKEMDDILNTLV